MKDEPHWNRVAAPAAAAPETIDRFLCFALYPASPAMTEPLSAPAEATGADLAAVPGAAGAVGTGWPLGLRAQRGRPAGLRHAHPAPETAGADRRYLPGARTQQDERRVLIFLTEQDRRLKITAAGVPADRVSVTDTACDELTERVATLRERLVRARA